MAKLALSVLAALCAGLVSACEVNEWFAGGDTALRVDQAVEDARDPVELGGERGVAGSSQLLDALRAKGL